MDNRYMKVRLRFSKKGVMKYIGHLDVMRYFQKAIRRGNIPIRYSEGFHPHQIMSFASPLGIGIESTGEYMDFELLRDLAYGDFLPAQMIIDRLNAVMNEGISIMDAAILPDKEPNAMASVAAASYRVSCEYKDKALEGLDPASLIRSFFNDADAIPVVKKTKKGEREVDLKPLIYGLEVVSADYPNICYDLFLSAGSQDNIKPQLVLDAFHEHLGLKKECCAFHITRTELYKESDGKLVGLI